MYYIYTRNHNIISSFGEIDYNHVILSDMLSVVTWYEPLSNSTPPTDIWIGTLTSSPSHKSASWELFVWTWPNILVSVQTLSAFDIPYSTNTIVACVRERCKVDCTYSVNNKIRFKGASNYIHTCSELIESFWCFKCKSSSIMPCL